MSSSSIQQKQRYNFIVHVWKSSINPLLHNYFITIILSMAAFLGFISIIWKFQSFNPFQNPNFPPFQNPNFTPIPWISAEFGPNYTSNLLTKWSSNQCNNSTTVDIKIPSLDNQNPNQIELSTGHIHEFVFQTLDDSGEPNPNCSSGDYFETDLSGQKWKSHPPVKDLGNGNYSFALQVHPDFAGDYNFTIILLFRNYDGLKIFPKRFAFDKLLRSISIKFRKSESPIPMKKLQHCKKSDYSKDIWSGRWTRHGRNDSCPIGDDGRFRCLELDFRCLRPWCRGPLGRLESDGWAYSAHCSFKLFTSDEAWDAVAGRWIFWWGDSNHCDTIRNMFDFIFDVPGLVVPRRFDANVTNWRNSSQVVRFTSIFNGHPNETGHWQGLNSMYNADYLELLKGYFTGDVIPDAVIMNSGLHDGIYWPNIRRFAGAAEYTAAFWAGVIEDVENRGLRRPEIIYRTTIATGGHARRLPFNPNKMEAFNGVMLDKFRKYGLVGKIVDDFDITYPWHYDNRGSDGIHYGRAPAKRRWIDGKIGHYYFVDVMLGHVLLNALASG
ncbi:uncharacterized protein LOC127249033 [Andrographis paniculata]|uniref:uncharacterized protein LOC127249033 n=1 Tax=Andrographis paniculata TaxID=175694 RepID=UPI0021E747E2|nr:uncharacterized protein LOC127249033 [Andrographis paniculata]